MQFRDSRIRARSAFTLVELLTVIAIIGVLVSLLMAAVFKVAGKGEEVNVRSDISQLSQGITAFMTKFNLTDPPPSRLFLSSNKNDYFVTPGGPLKPGVFQDSYEYLMRVWPRLDWSGAAGPIRWSLVNAGPVELQGHECLVYFLGGIPTAVPTPGVLGFSNNPRNPTTQGGERFTFFEFNTSRLLDPDVGEGTANGYYSYRDAYNKMPYAYFSSYKKDNRYNRYFAVLGNSDCVKLKDPLNPNAPIVWPYAFTLGSSARYLKPDTYQIVSAGSDGIFGSGTIPPSGLPVWNPKQAMYPAGSGGYDDISNFHDKLLGIPD